MAITVLWFRRDLRLQDQPAVLAAAAEAGEDGVLGLFVLDDALRRPAGAPRLAFLYRSLRSLDETMDGRLCVRTGDPVQVLPTLVRELGASSVHVSADFGPYGAERDRRVEEALAEQGCRLVRTGSPYAVAPGRVRREDGSPYRVYTPFFRAWTAHGYRAPAQPAAGLPWVQASGEPVPPDPDLGEATLPVAGEAAATARLEEFMDAVGDYADARDRPGTDATTRLSPYLKYGCLHPRTVLARLGDSDGERKLRGEIAWREFYADVQYQRPDAARQDLTEALAGMRYGTEDAARDDRLVQAWTQGRTGYPIVDAGMRQLATEAWVHNRVRMIVASFFVKDLHLPWYRGARIFLDRLVDGDLASNNQGWQWVAGTGTDPAPYFRIFNPTLQGQKFDPDGHYVRRYVPELADVPGAAVHEPAKLPGGPPNGYPAPIVEHAAERKESLERYREAREG